MLKIEKKHILKYLMEITTIVIGVLIAFYLTHWGEEVKERETEKEIIAQIYFELNDNLVDLKNDIEIHKNAQKSQVKVQEFIDSDRSGAEALMMDFYWTTRDEYIFPNTSAFEHLKEKGMSIVQHDSLRYLIALVYNNYFPRIAKEHSLHPDINAYLTPYFKKNFRINRDASIPYNLYLGDSLRLTYPRNFGHGVQQVIGYIPLQEELLKQDEEFRFLLSEILWFRVYKIHYYQTSISSVNRILRLIEKEYPEAIAQ